MAGTARAKCFVSIIPKGEARDLKAAATTEPEEIQALRAEVAARAELGEPTPQSVCRIGVVLCGRQAPGGNNIIDGLLRFADSSEHCKGSV